MADEPAQVEKKPDEKPPVWMAWSVPPHMRAAMPGGDESGGGYCVTLGIPNERMRVGRQVGGAPTLSQDEANAIAKVLNEIGAT